LSEDLGLFSASMECSVLVPKVSALGVALFDELLLDDVLGGGVTKSDPLPFTTFRSDLGFGDRPRGVDFPRILVFGADMAPPTT